MTTNDTLARASRIRTVQTSGRLLLVGGVLGVIAAAVIIGWPRDVPSSRFSYPFTANDFVIAQLALFAQGLALMLGFLTLAASTGTGSVRWARVGLRIAGGGLAVLEVVQLVAITAASTANDSTLGNTLHVLYLVPVVLIAIGVYVVIPMSPMLAGPFILGQLGLGGLMLLFAIFGGLLQSTKS